MMCCWRNLYRIPCRIVHVSCCSWKSGFEIYSSQVLQAPHWPIKRFLNFSSFLVLLQSESENFLQFNQRNNQQIENWIHLGRENRWIRWIQWIQWIQITVLVYPLLNQTFIEIRAKIYIKDSKMQVQVWLQACHKDNFISAGCRTYNYLPNDHYVFHNR